MQAEDEEAVTCGTEMAFWWHRLQRRILIQVNSPHWVVFYRVEVRWASRVMMQWKGVKQCRTEWRLGGKGLESYSLWTSNRLTEPAAVGMNAEVW